MKNNHTSWKQRTLAAGAAACLLASAAPLPVQAADYAYSIVNIASVSDPSYKDAYAGYNSMTVNANTNTLYYLDWMETKDEDGNTVQKQCLYSYDISSNTAGDSMLMESLTERKSGTTDEYNSFDAYAVLYNEYTESTFLVGEFKKLGANTASEGYLYDIDAQTYYPCYAVSEDGYFEYYFYDEETLFIYPFSDSGVGFRYDMTNKTLYDLTYSMAFVGDEYSYSYIYQTDASFYYISSSLGDPTYTISKIENSFWAQNNAMLSIDKKQYTVEVEDVQAVDGQNFLMSAKDGVPYILEKDGTFSSADIADGDITKNAVIAADAVEQTAKNKISGNLNYLLLSADGLPIFYDVDDGRLKMYAPIDGYDGWDGLGLRNALDDIEDKEYTYMVRNIANVLDTNYFYNETASLKKMAVDEANNVFYYLDYYLDYDDPDEYGDPTVKQVLYAYDVANNSLEIACMMPELKELQEGTTSYFTDFYANGVEYDPYTDSVYLVGYFSMAGTVSTYSGYLYNLTTETYYPCDMAGYSDVEAYFYDETTLFLYRYNDTGEGVLYNFADNSTKTVYSSAFLLGSDDSGVILPYVSGTDFHFVERSDANLNKYNVYKMSANFWTEDPANISEEYLCSFAPNPDYVDDYGILATIYQDQPYLLENDGSLYAIDYEDSDIHKTALISSDEIYMTAKETITENMNYLVLSADCLPIFYDETDGQLKIVVKYQESSSEGGTENSGLLGDVNENGTVDSDDAVLVLKEYANSMLGGESILTNKQKYNADVDKSEVVDSDDAVKILKYYAASMLGTPSWEDIL